MYLGWYDPDKRKTAAQKIATAATRYRQKWGRVALVAIVNPADLVAVEGLDVRASCGVPPSTFFVGEEEEAEDDEL